MTTQAGELSMFRGLWAELAPIGRSQRTGGYTRQLLTQQDEELREWFVSHAEARGMDVEVDGNGNQWAWWGAPGDDAVVTGSHLDSVPDGGAYDGPLGIVAAFLAVDDLRRRGVTRRRPFAIVNFVEEEGARFGLACLGSRLLTGAVDPRNAIALTDRNGTRLGEAFDGAGIDVRRIGPDIERVRRIGVFLELHVEQGRHLVDRGVAVGVASAIWPHGRYRFDFRGEANHAGTTRMRDRSDPMLTFAATALAANREARRMGQRATFGRVEVTPNGTNAIPSSVTAWLDARCVDQATLGSLVDAIWSKATLRSLGDGTSVEFVAESVADAVDFPRDLARRLAQTIGKHPAGSTAAPILPTQAGHDAGILSVAGVPSAMLFVRNPTGVSHSPREFAEDADCIEGVRALSSALELLLADLPA
ncbi:allantoate amidohydrolase [Nocardioides sp.]|uniref:allantoate amidohydrolase n=1 Tax=Nocardioides sp. TaxID=35761 RepID=UPI0035ADB711